MLLEKYRAEILHEWYSSVQQDILTQKSLFVA